MQDAWITLSCPDCGESWEEAVADMPAPDTDFQCDHCGAQRRTAEFTKTQRDLEVLKNFH